MSNRAVAILTGDEGVKGTVWFLQVFYYPDFPSFF